MKIIAAILLLASVGLNFKHGWDAFRSTSSPESNQMLTDLGLPASIAPYMGVLSIVTALLLLFPRTFFIGNVIAAVTIVLIMALSLHMGKPRIALIEIPFLAIPLLLIWLKHPLQH